jgi:predicted enzyme related to lactoylglutathione lyase
MGLAIGMVTVDCADPEKLSGFWAAALETQVASGNEYFVVLAPPPLGGPLLGFQRVPEELAGKNRLHLDLGAQAGNRHAEVERLVELGATVLGERGDPTGFVWTTLTDPEGNQFCVGEKGA